MEIDKRTSCLWDADEKWIPPQYEKRIPSDEVYVYHSIFKRSGKKDKGL